MPFPILKIFVHDLQIFKVEKISQWKSGNCLTFSYRELNDLRQPVSRRVSSLVAFFISNSKRFPVTSQPPVHNPTKNAQKLALAVFKPTLLFPDKSGRRQAKVGASRGRAATRSHQAAFSLRAVTTKPRHHISNDGSDSRGNLFSSVAVR